jgi:radical SAM protein (TIGR01212 family)
VRGYASGLRTGRGAGSAQRIQRAGYEIWLELGLQTAHDKTLHRINRGHDFACYQRTTRLARERGLKVCSHLIVGLPEGKQHGLETLEKVVETGVDGIKLHPLHIVKGSIMAKAWEAGRLNGIELEEYTVTAGEMIRHTPPEIIYHRISASARRPTLLAPLWCENRWTGMVEIDRYLHEQDRHLAARGFPVTGGDRLTSSLACRVQSDW